MKRNAWFLQDQMVEITSLSQNKELLSPVKWREMQQTKKKFVKYRGELYADQTQWFFSFPYVFDFL